MRALQIARFVLLAPSPPQLAPHRVIYALEVTTVLLVPLRGLDSIADAAATVLTALALQLHAPTKCLQLADGVLCKSKALHSSWKQPTASTTASGTSHQATACSANASKFQKSAHFTLIAHAPPRISISLHVGGTQHARIGPGNASHCISAKILAPPGCCPGGD